MTVDADGRLVGDHRDRPDKSRTHLLTGAAFLLTDLSAAIARIGRAGLDE